MFSKINSNYDNYSDYDSDNSDYSLESSLSNSSNFTITSNPINHCMKNNLKQIHSPRKIQLMNNLEKRRLLLKYKDHETNEILQNNKNIGKNIGFDSGLNKDTPFINYLINKRINFCELGASSHIAAFIPSTYNSRYCFIRGWKGKDHYG